MKPEIKELWIKALESGEYAQCRHVLNDGAGMCCLGVLTDIAVKQGIGKWEPIFDDSGDYDEPTIIGYGFVEVEGGHRDDELLPSAVARWAGLDLHADNVVIGVKKDGRDLEASGANDDDKMSFLEIAALIRKSA